MKKGWIWVELWGVPWTLETGQWTANKKDQRAAFFHQMNDNLKKKKNIWTIWWRRWIDTPGLKAAAGFSGCLHSQHSRTNGHQSLRCQCSFSKACPCPPSSACLCPPSCPCQWSFSMPLLMSMPMLKSFLRTCPTPYAPPHVLVHDLGHALTCGPTNVYAEVQAKNQC